jgi:hypothetical protein
MNLFYSTVVLQLQTCSTNTCGAPEPGVPATVTHIAMKQTCLNFEETKPGFDLLSCLAEHGAGELLEHVVSFVVPGRKVETMMMIGDESGWKPNMRVASHGRFIELLSPEDLVNTGLSVTQTSNGKMFYMTRSSISFTGIVAAGLLHLTEKPDDLEVVQLTSQDRLSINTFPEVDASWSDTYRNMQTYDALIKRDTVFVRKADGTLCVSQGLNPSLERLSEEGEAEDVTTAADVREMVRKSLMPIEDGDIRSEASEESFLTLETISKSVVLKTKVSTFGKLPVAFRLDSIANASHTECASTNHWALLVPTPWTLGKISKLKLDAVNILHTFHKPFNEVASAIVDNLIITNSALVPNEMPMKKESYSIFDYTKIRHTPEGGRLKVAAIRSAAFSRSVFEQMCAY